MRETAIHTSKLRFPKFPPFPPYFSSIVPLFISIFPPFSLPFPAYFSIFPHFLPFPLYFFYFPCISRYSSARYVQEGRIRFGGIQRGGREEVRDTTAKHHRGRCTDRYVRCAADSTTFLHSTMRLSRPLFLPPCHSYFFVCDERRLFDFNIFF